MSDAALIPPVPPAPRSTVRCRRCGRPLHDPESRLLRLGPECRTPDPDSGARPGEQDTLPGLER
ncbi:MULTISPECIES: DUF6011 domain-containing protein [Kitasatospora]|uniref:Uncharacterized protein n=2 Tax=Kitasatospora TaxID=2063 RepID=A0ABT1IZY0_9ACTN|nr:DUF6011 domain-containing protein [Kitasatospora paracochleata]MCP2310704.1 hypothetical protein [Kitasatospora paracochleata]